MNFVKTISRKNLIINKMTKVIQIELLKQQKIYHIESATIEGLL